MLPGQGGKLTNLKNEESAVLPPVLGGRAPHHWRRQMSVAEMVAKIDFVL